MATARRGATGANEGGVRELLKLDWSYVFRTLRAIADEKQNELAVSLGCVASYLCLIESGARVPSVEFLTKLSEHYGVAVSEIVRLAEHDHSVLPAIAAAVVGDLA